MVEEHAGYAANAGYAAKKAALESPQPPPQEPPPPPPVPPSGSMLVQVVSMLESMEVDKSTMAVLNPSTQALYTSPNKAEIMQEMGDDCDDATLVAELESERWSRRRSAMAKVPGQRNDAQRSATARSKRAIGVQAAPQKRCDRKPWGYTTGFFERRVGMEPGCLMPGHVWAAHWKQSGGTTGVSSMWSAYDAALDAWRRKESSVRFENVQCEIR